MGKDNRILGLILARGNSKRLPGKNIRMFCGKPLIGWTIESAKKCGSIDEVIVSTDNNDIAEVAKTFGAEVPFLRPKELAEDNSTSMDAVVHALDWLAGKGKVFDVIVLLQPTSPLRTADDIDRALESMFENKARAVVGVVPVKYSPSSVNTLTSDGKMDHFSSGLRQGTAGDQEERYRINGAMYAGYCDYIKGIGGFIGPDTIAYVMPPERSVDIDEAADFILAEQFMEKIQGKASRA